MILSAFLCVPDLLFAKEKKYEFVKPLMGSRFRLVFYAGSDSIATDAAHRVFGYLEKLNAVMSDYLDGSEVNRLSGLSGNGYWVRTSPDLYNVLDSAAIYSRMTNGAFDVTIGPVTQVWRRALRLNRFPDKKHIRKALQKKGYHQLLIDQKAGLVRLSKPGMRIDLGGIGKGYAADAGMRILKELGIHSALVDAGGDLVLSAPPPGEAGWKIAVSSGETLASDQVLTLSDCGVATSGATYRYVEHRGEKYSHILDPETGVGLTRQVRATIIAANGTRADALATAVSVLTIRKSRKVLSKFPGTRAWLLELNPRTGKSESWNSEAR